jgi:hemoglobin
MYPDADLSAAERRLRLFLTQYWGGPTTYSQERGHPRLRMRHAPFTVDDEARERWVASMRRALDLAVDEHGLDPVLERELWAYLTGAAQAMVNTMPGPAASPLPMSDER